MITLTDNAIKALKEVSVAEDVGHLSIRVRVIGGGCAGFTYDMHFDNLPTDIDEVLIFEDIKIIVDPVSFQYLDGTNIDYLSGVISKGFKFNNPNTTGSCGCGSSFKI